MSFLSAHASATADDLKAYVAALLDALGDREALDVLTATPDALAAGAAGLSRDDDGRPEAPGKWSVRELVQHLADSELVGGFRYRMVLAHDAPVLPAYDQDRWAGRLHYADADLATALADFARLRGMNLRLLRRATPADHARVMRHPERGDESLAHMMRLYAGHDLIHLRQLARIRAAIGR